MVTITQETILAARQEFAALCDAAIKDAQTGAVFVNDLASYTTWQEGLKADSLAGKHDGTFSFWQRCVYIQTGECVPFLSN